jgi:hypothetical protein
MKLHHRHWQRVYTALTVSSYIEYMQHHLPDQIESVHQPSPASVEAALRRDVREQVAMPPPFRNQRQLGVPPLALPNQAHAHQFAVRAARWRTWTREEMADLPVGIFHEAVHPQTEIVKAQIVKATKVRYHWVSSVFGSGWCCNRFLTKPEVSLSTNPI